MKSFSTILLAASLGAVIQARPYSGKCMDMTRASGMVTELEKNPEQLDGLWYEIKKDKFTFFEYTGKCNRAKLTAQGYEKDLETGEFDYSKPVDMGEKYLTEDGDEVSPGDGFHTVYHLSNSQEGKVFDKAWVYTGGVAACPDDQDSEENCKMDWGTSSGMGIAGRAPSTIIASDEGKNWFVTYSCRQKIFNLKNEWIWVHSREPTLSEEHLAAAMAAIKEFLPDFKEDRLTDVT